MSTSEWHPRLARRARLRFDPKSGQHVLLSPERGLVLNATAADILRRCNGDYTVDAIADELAGRYEGVARETLEADIKQVLRVVSERGLLDRAP
jgi:pyrroloquinoline quinone biosynthesis protein D